jgi:hypothetical protein
MGMLGNFGTFSRGIQQKSSTIRILSPPQKTQLNYTRKNHKIMMKKYHFHHPKKTHNLKSHRTKQVADKCFSIFPNLTRHVLFD